MSKYRFHQYDYLDRWVSYWHQINEVLKLNPMEVLEIGIGSRMVFDYLSRFGLKVKTLDLDQSLNPDFVASVVRMPLPDNSFNVILCAEVLEHLPFEDFETALLELKRVTKKNVVLSLPHFGPPVKICFKIPFLPEVRLAFKIPVPLKHRFNGEHHWEIGKQGYPCRRIRGIIRKHFEIRKEFIPFENQYHHFFVLEK